MGKGWFAVPIQCADVVLFVSHTLETCKVLQTNVTPKQSIKTKRDSVNTKCKNESETDYIHSH